MVKAHIKLWLVAIFLMLLVIPFVLPPEHARARVMDEYNSAASIFGKVRAGELAGKANEIYTAIMQGSGLAQLVQAAYVKEHEIKQQQNLTTLNANVNRDMSGFSNDYLLTFTTQIYGVFFRGAIMVHWVLYVGMFLIAAMVDGIVQRRIKQDLMRMNAPIKFAASFHTLVFVFFTPIAYLLLPIQVTPWFMPVWAVVVAFPLSQAIANFAKIG